MNHLSIFESVAERVAREAGSLLLTYFQRIETIEYKGIGDIVTEADKASETFIREALRGFFPDIPFYGEEYGFADTMEESEYCWAVDPLDGTANFAASIPLFAVSIGLLQHGMPVVGVIYDPTRQELFRATHGGGAYRNGKPCKVSTRDPFDPVAPIAVSSDVLMPRLPILKRCHKGRSLGAAALHLSYVAAGIFDAAMDPITRLWDVTAGAVLIQEAGGVVTRWDGQPRFPVTFSDSAFRGGRFEYLVSNGHRHTEIVALLVPDL